MNDICANCVKANVCSVLFDFEAKVRKAPPVSLSNNHPMNKDGCVPLNKDGKPDIIAGIIHCTYHKEDDDGKATRENQVEDSPGS